MGLYFLCRESKCVDQLCSNYTADLRLCFCICKKACFSHEVVHIVYIETEKAKRIKKYHV